MEIVSRRGANDRALAAQVRSHGRGRGFEVIVRTESARATLRSDGFVFDSPFAAASFLISAALDLPNPFLTGDPATFNAVCDGLEAAREDYPILLEGETGTGKESLVRIIDSAGGNRGALKTVSCIALDDELRGDGAHESSRARADDAAVELTATVVLDHVNELSPAAQRRLCALIRGESDPAAMAGIFRNRERYVATCNWPLREFVARGNFNRELHAALSVRTIAIAPLRERVSDAALIGSFLLHQLNPRLAFGRAALRALAEYPFPGNVRELRNLVIRLSIVPLVRQSGTVDPRDVRAQLMAAGRQLAPDAARSWYSCCAEAHREIAVRALQACNGDRAAAARHLGVALTELHDSLAPVRRRGFSSPPDRAALTAGYARGATATRRPRPAR
jgi:DNA-binding NtrC family response regulator